MLCVSWAIAHVMAPDEAEQPQGGTQTKSESPPPPPQGLGFSPSGRQDWLGKEQWATIFPFLVTILWISSIKFPGSHFAYCPHRAGRSFATMPLWLSLCSPGAVLYKPLHFPCCYHNHFPWPGLFTCGLWLSLPHDSIFVSSQSWLTIIHSYWIW